MNCSKCNSEHYLDLHVCPYEEDVNENYEFQCDCCANCMSDCRDDI